jgi:hypothetical protein
MFRLFPVVLASAAVIACGVVHGFWKDRWVKSPEPVQAAARYADVPLTIAEWDGETIDSKSQQGDEVSGWLQRRYRNRRTGEAVIIALVCGRPGPVSIHTPDVCYGASGFNVGTPHRVTVPGNKGEFWTADAVKGSATGETQLRIFWGWDDGFGWRAADDARQTFPRAPVLHKLYVLREMTTLAKDDNEPCVKFLEALVPVLDKTVMKPGPG